MEVLIERQFPHALSRQRKQGIAQSRCGQRGCTFTGAVNALATLMDVDVNRGHLVNAHDSIVMKVGLVDCTVRQCYFSAYCRRQTKYERRLDLAFEITWVQRDSHIDSDGCLDQPDSCISQRNLQYKRCRRA